MTFERVRKLQPGGRVGKPEELGGCRAQGAGLMAMECGVQSAAREFSVSSSGQGERA